jgi:hypothetical protein
MNKRTVDKTIKNPFPSFFIKSGDLGFEATALVIVKMVPEQSTETAANDFLRRIKFDHLIGKVRDKIPPKFCPRPERAGRAKTDMTASTPVQSKAIFGHPLFQTVFAKEKVMEDFSSEVEMPTAFSTALGTARFIRKNDSRVNFVNIPAHDFGFAHNPANAFTRTHVDAVALIIPSCRFVDLFKFG